MRKIRLFYAVASEGLAHATRALAVIDKLPAHCEVHLFTLGRGHAYLAARGYPFLHEIDGLHFATTRDGRISYGRSLVEAQGFIWFRCRAQVRAVCRLAEELRPSLCITDFDPTMPRVARKLDIPCISIDSQHRFRYCSSSELPPGLRLYCKATAWFVRLLVPSVEHAVIGSFCWDHLRLTAGNSCEITLTNGMLRPALGRYEPKDEGFVLVYLHPEFQKKPALLEHIRSVDTEFRVYGYGPLPAEGNAVFKDFSYEAFIQDLANCRAVICHGGNQLLTEARSFGKRVLVIPIRGQYEGYVNAHYLRRMNMGVVCMPSELSGEYISGFLARTAGENGPARTMEHNGADDAARVIMRYVPAE